MADRYWVGGSGTWATTARWAASSGGAGGQSVPTANDDVYIDTNSNTGTGSFTITVSATANCRSISFDADGVCTLARGSAQMNINGSWFNSATNFAITGSGTTNFVNNAGQNGGTINHNGITWPGNIIVFNGVGCTWTLNSNITQNNTVSTITHTAGAIDLNGYTWSLSRYTASSVVSARDVYFRAGSFTMIGTTAADPAINISGTNWRCDCPRANSYNAIAAGATGGFRRSMGATCTMAIGTAVDNASEMYPYNAPNLSITGGASALTLNIYCTVNNLDFTGYTGTPSSSGTLTTTSRAGGFGVFIAGDCTFGSGTYTGLLMSFYRFIDQDTTTAQFNANSKQLAAGVAIMLPQATDTTQTTMSITNAPTAAASATNVVQLVKGRIALTGNWAVGMFRSSYTNVRGIDFDVNYILLNTASTATAALNAPIIDNFDSTGSGGFGQSVAGSRTLTWGTTSGASATTAAPYIMTATTGTIDLGGSHFKKIDVGSSTSVYPTTSFSLWGDATLSNTASMTAVTITYRGSGGTDTFIGNGRTIASLTVNAPGSTLSLNGALTVGTTGGGIGLTLAYGTIQTNDNTLSMQSFTVSAPFEYSRTLALGTSQCPLTSGTAATVIYNAPDASNFNITGTGGFTRSVSATSTISSHSSFNISSGFDGLPSFTFSAGSSATTFTTASQIYSLNFTGGTSSVTGSQIQIYGDTFQLSATGTYTGLNVILRSQGSQNVYGNGKTLGTLQVSGAVSGASIVGTTFFLNGIGCSTFTHSTGGVYIDAYQAVTCTSYSSPNTGVRSLQLDLGGGFTIPTNNATVIELNGTNLTLLDTIYFNLSYTGAVGTRTIILTNFTAADTSLVPVSTNVVDVNDARNIYINPAATDTVAVQGTWKDMTLGDSWAGTISTGTGLTLYGNLTLGSTVNTASTASALTFAPTTGRNVTTSGRTINFPITFTTTSTNSLNFQDALTMSSLRALTITNGGILRFFSGTTNTVGSFVTTGTTIKYLQSSTSGSRATISAASGTLAVTYLSIKDSAATGGAIWDATDPTNIDQGNNTGWIFAGGVTATGNMFIIFN